MSHDLFFEAANARALGKKGVPRVWTVSQVNSLARELLEGSVPLLRVAGEISGFKRYPAGQCYFTLKDEHAQIGCVMWSEAARKLPTAPPEGLAVRAFGHPSVFVRAGRLQFVVRELETQGEGLWRLAFDRLRKKLAAEGLLDPARKRPLPRFPAKVGLVTSTEGAALRDMVSIIRRRAPWTDILVYATRVQGDGAPQAIAAAIGAASRTRSADVLIVGRGGGSREDLWAFNDERVARAIALAQIPIISAVGHETDVTIADLVADDRAPTPSAAAQLAVPDAAGLQANLTRTAERLSTTLRARVKRQRRRLEAKDEQLIRALGQVISGRRVRLESLAQRLGALGPTAVLERGYAIALGPDGRILRSSRDFRVGLEFALRMKDGRVRARAEGSERGGRGE